MHCPDIMKQKEKQEDIHTWYKKSKKKSSSCSNDI